MRTLNSKKFKEIENAGGILRLLALFKVIGVHPHQKSTGYISFSLRQGGIASKCSFLVKESSSAVDGLGTSVEFISNVNAAPF